MEIRQTLWNSLKDIEDAPTLEVLQAASETLRDELSIDHLVYHWVDSTGEQYGCGTYSDEWVDRYLEQNYLRIDPVIAGCLQQFKPLDWRQLDWSSKTRSAFREEAISYGVGNQGYSVPIRGPNGQFALFTVNATRSDHEWDVFISETAHTLILIAQIFNQKALEFEPGRNPQHLQPLSPREVEAISLLSQGHSRAQIANMLNISEHTLRVYIEGARLKLGAMNTTHAVARAIGWGLVSL